MNEDDRDHQVPRVSKVEERERLLAQAMAHAEALDAQFRVLPAGDPRHGAWKSPLALLFFLLAVVVAVAPPSWVAGPPPPSIQEQELERGLRAAIYLQALQVEAFRARTGRLPEDLAELPTPAPGLSLVRSNTRVFQISGRRPGGAMLVYDSAHPEPEFAAAGAAWAGELRP
ncbi:MAG TPA: hypothetical protein VLA36_12640 [Longimicrobiales bacterium]|nr:hypothetical protein [Longimicrobiales bacterium]